MEDILREPVILIDEDLDEIAGGFLNVNFNNFDSNQGIQAAVLNDNVDSNQGFQGINFDI